MIHCLHCGGTRHFRDTAIDQPAGLLGELVVLGRDLSRALFVSAFKAERPQEFPDYADAGADADELTDLLANVLARLMAAEDVGGREDTLLEVRRPDRDERKPDDLIRPGAADAKNVLGRLTRKARDFVTIPFDEAVADLVSKTPLAVRTAEDVATAYSSHRFTLKQGITLDVTRTVQETIARLIRDGGTARDFIEQARVLGKGLFSDAYAQTVFRTERTGAYAAGRVAQAFTPELDEFVLGFRYQTVGDADTRQNHRVNHNLIFAKGDSRWAGRIPPNGWNCRCRVVMVSRVTARRLNRLDGQGRLVGDDPPAGGEPDPGFENSPLMGIYSNL